MSAVFYYLFVLPLSRCPLWITYRVADFFYLVLITVFPYRKKITDQNLANAFPEKTGKERRQIRRKFYRFVADILAETIYNLGMSEKQLRKRYRIINPELMQELYDRKKDVILISAHYHNWEWMITGQPLFFPHQAVGIGEPLTSGFWNKKITKLRERFGMHVIHSKTVAETCADYKSRNIPIATLVLADHSPRDSSRSYWTMFMNQQTAVVFGPELLANTSDAAVVFYLPEKVSRGVYNIHLQLITDQPRSLAWGEITEKHVQLLEERLKIAPPFWLWSHKRWKRHVPENLAELRAEQKASFESKFRS